MDRAKITPMLPASAVTRALGFACVMGLAAPAWAASPEVDACTDKSEGDPCGVMKLVKPADGGELQRTTVPGACRQDECCDLDYSKGSPPETVCNPCLACKDGPADPAAASNGKATPASDTAPANDTAPGNNKAAGYSDGPPPPEPTQQRGCSVGTAAPPSGVGPWLCLLLLVLPRRR